MISNHISLEDFKNQEGPLGIFETIARFLKQKACGLRLVRLLYRDSCRRFFRHFIYLGGSSIGMKKNLSEFVQCPIEIPQMDFRYGMRFQEWIPVLD